MNQGLGTIGELPEDYVSALRQQNLVPLWPFLRGFLPYGIPERKARPAHFSYEAIRPLLLQAGDLTPIEKAERRVLVLCNPGYPPEDAMVTPSIYVGLQLIQPAETAPNHLHTPSAVRLVVEGEGGFTTVRGEKLPMEPGDLILTPPGLWHEHGHEGSGPVVWMDALDLPLVYRLEASFCEEGVTQNAGDAPDSSLTRYRRSGVLPYKSLAQRDPDYPLLRFPWQEVRLALRDLARATPAGEAVHLAYVNPETGEECMPVLGFSALMLRPGEELKLPRRSASAVLKVVEGGGRAVIDGEEFSWQQHDIMAVPTHSPVLLGNDSTKEPAFLFLVDDAPLQRRMKIYEEFS
jgi:gentisate 1,2-dioxygenase